EGPSQVLTLTPTELEEHPTPTLSPRPAEPDADAESGLPVIEVRRRGGIAELYLDGAADALECAWADRLQIAAPGVTGEAFFHGPVMPFLYGKYFGKEAWQRLESTCLQAHDWSHARSRSDGALVISAQEAGPFGGSALFDLAEGARVAVT